MENGRENKPGVVLEDEVRLEEDREGLIETVAQLWDDASRETNPVLRQRLIESIQKRTKRLPQDVQDAITLRAHDLMWYYKGPQESGE